MIDEGIELLECGIDYQEAMERFGGNEALYWRLAVKFLQDPHCAALEDAMDANDIETAQREAHALKGVAGNLSFYRLYQAACRINDTLRTGDLATAQTLMVDVREAQSVISDILTQMQK